MSNTYFTSDTHFFHHNVIQFCQRPFKDVEHMNVTLVDNWNSVVMPEDHVWFLGDFSFGKEDQTKEILSSLKGIKHLIVGNHDRKGRSQKLFNRDWQEFFVDTHDYFRLKVDEYKVVLCHFPMASWERGYVNLHGHWHSPAGYQNKFRQYDVGVDANEYKPISIAAAWDKAEQGIKTPEATY